jgi:hypothetical protein
MNYTMRGEKSGRGGKMVVSTCFLINLYHVKHHNHCCFAGFGNIMVQTLILKGVCKNVPAFFAASAIF